MLTVACVNVGDYLGRGAQYVATLRAMVERNLKQPFEFVVLGDEDAHGLTGWWAKVEMFRPGRFTGRVLYLDLDVAITGPLDDLVAARGIIDLHDWGWKTHTLCSTVMVWDAGEHEEVFTQFDESVVLKQRGDQDWITHLGGWKILPKHLCCSYRYHSVEAPPKGRSVVNFHGQPKPHEVLTGWVPEVWKQ